MEQQHYVRTWLVVVPPMGGLRPPNGPLLIVVNQGIRLVFAYLWYSLCMSLIAWKVVPSILETLIRRHQVSSPDFCHELELSLVVVIGGRGPSCV
jgi:hypothetical protein